MKTAFQVEVKGQKEKYVFATLTEAETYAITATAWVNGKYKIAKGTVKDTFKFNTI